MLPEFKLGCRFYRSDVGNEPVRDWLRGLPDEVRKAIGDDIRFIQWGWPVGRPLVDSLGEGLWEARTSYDRNTYRVIFEIQDGVVILIHGFQKKTARTPKRDLVLARQRQKERR